MKKIVLIFLVLTACLKSFSQHPIGTDSLSLQTLANSNTLVKSKGAIGSDSGFVNTVYPDTTSANYGKIKNYPGAQIRVGDSIWLRNSTATQWLNLSAGSGVTATSLTWQNTLDNGSALTHNNFSDMQGSDFFFDNGGIFTFNVGEFAIPYLSTPAGNQDVFIGADEFGNLYKKQLVLPVDSGGFSGTQDWQSTIDYGNRMRHHNTVHFVNYDWYMDSLGNTSEFSGQSATFDNPIGAYTEKHQDSANAYLYSQDTTEIQGTEVRVHPDSTHMQAWDASGNNTYFTLFRKGTVRTFASVADTLDAPVINFPQFHNVDSSQNQINIDEQGNLYWTNKASGTGASDRFGIEDNLGLQDRAVDMQNFKFNYTNSKIGINTTGSLFAELQVGDPVIHNPVSPSDVNVAFHGLMYLSSDNVTNRSGVFAVVASNTNGFYPVYSVRRSRGTISLPTATQLGDTLFKYGAAGHNGTDFETYNSAGSQVLAAGNHSLTSTPTMMSFGVTPIGTTTQLPSLTLNQDLGIQFNDYASTGSPHTGTVSGLLGYDASGNVIQTSVSGSGGITSESDPIANAKTITENDGYGLVETQTATQTLSTNPSWTRRIDTFAIETRARGLKIADSIGSVISARVYVDTAFTIPAIYTDTVKYTKGSNTYTAALIDHSDDRLFGLNVTSGGGLTLNVTSGAFRLLDGNRYTSPGGSTTLATADPSLPRKDVIYVDNTGAIGHITGTAATNPTTPQVDPVTQLFLTEVTVDAGATTIGVTPTIIYDEPATDAFTGTNTGVTVNYTNTSNVQHLTQSADVSSWTTGQTITFTKNTGTLVASDYSSLSGFIKLKVALANTANIRVSFLNGTTVVSSVVTLAAAQGFSKTVLTYQNIAIPISAFTFTNTTFNKIKITLAGTGGGFYLDYFQLQNGVSQSTLETDPVATAKTITVTPGIGMSGAASTQQLNVNPSFTTNVDTFAIETRARGLKIVDSVIQTAFTTTTQVNSSTYTLNRGNGTKDTIQFTVTATAPGGNNTDIQFNDGGVFGGKDSLTYDKTTNVVVHSGSFWSAATPAASEMMIQAINRMPATATKDNYGGIIASAGNAWQSTGTVSTRGWAGFRSKPATGTSISTQLEFLIGTGTNVTTTLALFNTQTSNIGTTTLQVNSGTGSFQGNTFFSSSAASFKSGNLNNITIADGANTNQILYASSTTQDMHWWAGQAQGGTSDQGVSWFFGRPASFGIGLTTNSASGTTVTGSNTRFLESFKKGDQIVMAGETRTVSAIASNTSMTTDAWTNAHSSVNYTFVGTTTGLAIMANGKTGFGTLSPSSLVHINGSLGYAYVSKAVDYTVDDFTDHVIEVTVTGKTITLPTAVGCTGRTYTVKLTVSGSGTVATTSSQTIDGSTTYSLSAQYKYVTIVSNGANWIITANN